ncbi:MAG: hypothetical protein AAFN78_04115 [Pseudomonadota bacterium]
MKSIAIAGLLVGCLASSGPVLAQNDGDADAQIDTNAEGVTFNDNDEFIQSVDVDLLDPAEVPRFEDSTPELRYRVATLNSDYLLRRIRDTERNPNAPLVLHLFPDTVLSALVTSSREWTSGPRTGRASWSGKLVEPEKSKIHLFVTHERSIRGFISTPHGHYEITPSEFLPYHFIWQRDTSSERPID